ncbi:hypothetical protein [Yunchengibacter salinarum]|uniref:hypothetical protein n=1 Tax=Yunchengibacter salinarum TaxID=3133399 RepID=UPI0035B608EF
MKNAVVPGLVALVGLAAGLLAHDRPAAAEVTLPLGMVTVEVVAKGVPVPNGQVSVSEVARGVGVVPPGHVSKAPTMLLHDPVRTKPDRTSHIPMPKCDMTRPRGCPAAGR